MIDVKRKIETKFPGYYIAPIDEFMEMSEKGVSAVYLYSSNVLKDGKISRFDNSDRSVRVMKKNGVTMAPVSLFCASLTSIIVYFTPVLANFFPLLRQRLRGLIGKWRFPFLA